MRRIVLQPDDNVFPVSARDVAGIQLAGVRFAASSVTRKAPHADRCGAFCVVPLHRRCRQDKYHYSCTTAGGTGALFTSHSVKMHTVPSCIFAKIKLLVSPLHHRLGRLSL